MYLIIKLQNLKTNIGFLLHINIKDNVTLKSFYICIYFIMSEIYHNVMPIKMSILI